MCAASASLDKLDPVSSSDCAAQCRFQRISVVSPYGSIFYMDSARSGVRKSLEINILGEPSRKECRLSQPDFTAKSLFRNILPVSPYGSRFYADLSQPRTSKLLGIKILEERSKKMW